MDSSEKLARLANVVGELGPAVRAAVKPALLEIERLATQFLVGEISPMTAREFEQ